MIKVLHIIKSLGRGGAETLLVSTIKRHNVKYRFTVVYFLPWKNQLVDELREAGANVVCIKANNNLAILARIPSLVRLIKDNRYDIIHAHLPWSGVMARCVRRVINVPLVYTEHNKLERYHIVTRLLNNITLTFNDKVIAVSEEVANSIRIAKGEKFGVETVVNGVDEKRYSVSGYSKDRERKNLKLNLDHIVIINVCVFRVQKRLILWLRIARQIVDEFPAVRFLLVGDGPLRKQVLLTIDQLSLNSFVILPGLQSDVRPYLAAADIYMISSEFEGLPVSMLEGMSMSLPIVSTAAGGIGEVVQHGISGLIVPVEEPERLFDQIKWLLNNSYKIKKMGDAARESIVNSYSIDKMVESLECIYTKMLTKN